MAFNCSSGSTSVVGEVDAISTMGDAIGDTASSSATEATHTFSVPAGKYWVVKNICGFRTQAGFISCNVKIDAVDYIMYRVLSTTIGSYACEIKLKAGDSVVVAHGAGTSGGLYSYVVYEEYDV